jgi:hypothetical protein
MDCAIHASMDCESHGDVPGITRVPGVPYWWVQEARAHEWPPILIGRTSHPRVP